MTVVHLSSALDILVGWQAWSLATLTFVLAASIQRHAAHAGGLFVDNPKCQHIDARCRTGADDPESSAIGPRRYSRGHAQVTWPKSGQAVV